MSRTSEATSSDQAQVHDLARRVRDAFEQVVKLLQAGAEDLVRVALTEAKSHVGYRDDLDRLAFGLLEGRAARRKRHKLGQGGEPWGSIAPSSALLVLGRLLDPDEPPPKSAAVLATRLDDALLAHTIELSDNEIQAILEAMSAMLTACAALESHRNALAATAKSTKRALPAALDVTVGNAAPPTSEAGTSRAASTVRFWHGRLRRFAVAASLLFTLVAILVFLRQSSPIALPAEFDPTILERPPWPPSAKGRAFPMSVVWKPISTTSVGPRIATVTRPPTRDWPNDNLIAAVAWDPARRTWRGAGLFVIRDRASERSLAWFVAFGQSDEILGFPIRRYIAASNVPPHGIRFYPAARAVVRSGQPIVAPLGSWHGVREGDVLQAYVMDGTRLATVGSLYAFDVKGPGSNLVPLECLDDWMSGRELILAWLPASDQHLRSRPQPTAIESFGRCRHAMGATQPLRAVYTRLQARLASEFGWPFPLTTAP